MKHLNEHRTLQLQLFFNASQSQQPPNINLVKDFLNSIINQRKRLLINGSNKREHKQARHCVHFLETHLEMNRYNPQQMAAFYLRFFEKVSFICPPNRLEKAKELRTYCLTFFNN